jgi:cell wall-associated NlpC family hydrolase
LKELLLGLVLAGLLVAASGSMSRRALAVGTHRVKHPPATKAPNANQLAEAAKRYLVVQTARQYLGSPYAYVGDTPAGFSCIGFVTFVYRLNGIYVPGDIGMAWSSAPHVMRTRLMPGDILFFSNTVFAGLSHVAIYVGGGQMIGADNFAVGVSIDRLDDPYWASRYTGAVRPLASPLSG